ncbi:MAG: PfkB family carbohydrate kinase [Thermoplasmatota archaeon]
MQTPILVTGTVAYDDIETPFGAKRHVLGGSATYFSAAAALFAPVRLVAVVGGDFARGDLAFLERRGVDLAGLEVQPEGKTFHWSGRYLFDLNTRETLATDLNVLATFEPKVPPAWRDARLVFLANLDPTLQRDVLDQVADPALVVADTMNFWIEGARDALLDTLTRVDVLILNDAEARELAHEPNLLRAARAITKLGPRTIVIKKGEHGALLFQAGDVFSAPAYPLEEVCDPTGAGDTFAGGFLGALAESTGALGTAPLRDADLRRAIVYGSAAASFAVERFGVERLTTLTRGELDTRARAFSRLTAFDV